VVAGGGGCCCATSISAHDGRMNDFGARREWRRLLTGCGIGKRLRTRAAKHQRQAPPPEYAPPHHHLHRTKQPSRKSRGQQGGPFSPASFHYALSATYGSVKYLITTPSWLTASPKSGTVTTSAETITFTINSSAKNLTPNTCINFNNTTNKGARPALRR